MIRKIVFQSFRGSASSASLQGVSQDVVVQVEAKYPALLFRQQLTAYVEKIYGIIRDNLKRKLTPLVSNPAIALSISNQLTSSPNSSTSSSSTSPVETPKLALPDDNHQWKKIINILNDILSIFKDNYVSIYRYTNALLLLKKYICKFICCFRCSPFFLRKSLPKSLHTSMLNYLIRKLLPAYFVNTIQVSAITNHCYPTL